MQHNKKGSAERRFFYVENSDPRYSFGNMKLTGIV